MHYCCCLGYAWLTYSTHNTIRELGIPIDIASSRLKLWEHPMVPGLWPLVTAILDAIKNGFCVSHF